MRTISSPLVIAALGIMLLTTFAASAQDTSQPGASRSPVASATPDPDRPNLLGELGLSADQVQQIRKMNADRKPLIEAARKRLREANRSLDQAIYGESVDPTEFQARLKEYQDAQADVDRIRFESELNVRRILTPDQLIKFREVRRKFNEARRALKQQQQQQIPPLRPRQQLRQQLNRNQPLRPNP